MTFVKDMLKVKRQLEKLGHYAQIPHGTEPHLKDKTFVDNLEGNLKYCVENNIMKRCFNQVAESDALLVLNHDKNGIKGYIGASMLMEMGVAYHLNKKIFLFKSVPHYKDVRWAHEIAIMRPFVIGGDLSKIK